MIVNGKGGANTQTGEMFEIETDLQKNLIQAGIDLNKVIFVKKHDFPRHMKKYGFDMRENFGKIFFPMRLLLITIIFM